MTNLIEKVKNFKNVKIVDRPAFVIMYIEDNKILSKHAYVSVEQKLSTIDFIIENKYNYIFYIFELSENRARWYLHGDRRELNRIRQQDRKDKIKKIEKS